jgi:hypothetical protein
VAYKTKRFFTGIIDEVRIYNRALSDAEIQQLYDLARAGWIDDIVLSKEPLK